MNETKNPNVSQLYRDLSSIDIQKLLMERAKQTALSSALELLEQDMLTLCGARYARKVEELCRRRGTEKTSLCLEVPHHEAESQARQEGSGAAVDGEAPPRFPPETEKLVG